MKGTQLTELFANIKATFVSFFSIFMFAALGVGVFLGISWAGPALENAAQAMFDAGEFHNYQIQFPYGLTDDDLKQLEDVEGITTVEAERQSFQAATFEGVRRTVKVQSLGQVVDVPILVEGELPTQVGEIAMHAESAKSLGIKVGDTITFEHDASDDDFTTQLASAQASDETAANGASASEPENTSGMKYLYADSFKVTAIVNNADYVAKSSETYGFSTSAAGTVSALAWVVDDAFVPSAFQNGYPVVNVLADSLAGKNTFSDDYKKASNIIEGRMSVLAEELGPSRYDDLHGQAQKKIDDAEAQLNDAKQKIIDGEKEIAEGERKLEEGRAKLEQGRAEGQAKLDAALSELQGYEAMRNEAAQVLSEAQSAASEIENAVAGKSDSEVVEFMGYRMTIAEVKTYLPAAREELAKVEAEYNQASAQLDEGWNKYYAAQAEYESTVASYEQQIADGEARLEQARKEIADGKQKIAENEPKLESAKEQLAAMTKYDWTILPRAYNAGAGEVTTFSDVTDNLSISMALLFIIVGLLVSYFAVSRIVHEQITQIGTKKALGFRKGEITISFLWYSGIAVIAGAIVGAIIGYVLVEGIIGNVLAGMFAFGSYPAYFGWGLFLIMTLIELVLVLGATYLACRSILKEHAVELLRGEKPPAGKTRFYEKWGFWDKLPLFLQTIVNNCVNDRRRVLSTIVGVAGCTALIVTAITLNDDVLKSYDHHYENVYGFNAIARVNSEPSDAAAKVDAALTDEGATTARVFMKRYLLEQPNGESGAMRIVVPEDSDTFSDVFRVPVISGEPFDLSADGAWVSQAYADHFGAKVGDVVVIDGGEGVQHKVPILGIYEFWLTYHEMVMGRDYFEKEFDTATFNTILVDTDGAAVSEMKQAVSGIEGFDSITDDATYQHGNFEMFSKVSGAVVAIYLALAVLMAIVVLLNLNTMFIDEKKRELIVLMINGFSVKDARHYISYDNIVLTALGIIAGLILGVIMGSVTVASIEPTTAVFVKSADLPAILIGIVGAAVLALIMSLISLRRIGKFDLTDINRF